MADCIGTDFPQFSCALVRYSVVMNGCGYILKGEKRKRGGDVHRAYIYEVCPKSIRPAFISPR